MKRNDQGAIKYFLEEGTKLTGMDLSCMVSVVSEIKNENINNTTPKQLAVMFHEAYETLATSYGYETREDTKEFDPESTNGKLMIATCAVVLTQLKD